MASGFLFMSATEEQMKIIAEAKVSHVSYILIIYSIAFLLFLCKADLCCPSCASAANLSTDVNMLLHLYATHASPSKLKGFMEPPVDSRPSGEARRLRDAEDFELEGLMSDDEGTEPAANISRTKKLGK